MVTGIKVGATTIYDAGARIFLLALALLLGVPAIGALFTDHKARSAWENRPLASFPTLVQSEDGERFFSELDGYLNDHFGFALEVSRLYRKLAFYVFRDSPSSDISLGKDGFVFVTSFKSGPFTTLERLCVQGMDERVAVEAANAWVRILRRFPGKTGNAALIIVPSKPTVYPEKFTMAVPRRYRESCAQYDAERSVAGAIARAVQRAGYVALYPHKDFIRQKYDGNFYPRENFHYSGQSAHWLSRQALMAFGISISREYDEHQIVRSSTHDLTNLLGFPRRLTYAVYPYEHFLLRKELGAPRYVRDYFARARQFGIIEAGRPLSEKTVLVVGNSFTTFTVDHLAPGYKKLTYIMVNDLQSEEYRGFFDELIPRVGADHTIFVYNESVVGVAARMWAKVLLGDVNGGEENEGANRSTSGARGE